MINPKQYAREGVELTSALGILPSMKIEFTDEPIVHVWLKNFGTRKEPWNQMIEDFEGVLDTGGEGLEHVSQMVWFNHDSGADDLVGSEWEELNLPSEAISAAIRKHPLAPGHHVVMQRYIKADFTHLELPGYTYLGSFLAAIDENYDPENEL